MGIEAAKVTWTDEQMAGYRASAQKRQQQKRDRLRQRQQLGLAVAQQASELLKREFQVEKVVLFGSMRVLDRVHDRSDVDLAVWGLKPQDYFRAVGQLLALHPDMPVDLVEAETAPPRILHAIETTGVML
ncbi:MAG: nucleotidyltransferase domain-containing protein [Leptolyngbyaceae cyanobacterium bins.302]|nr:nucleotidyltransferase domain-containing protein [Leptolyngbyaceae cyanobacterium bins.302]